MDEQEEEEGALFADGFDDALVGVGQQFNNVIAVYDYERCIEILVDDNHDMSDEEAREYFEYNVIGAYVGERTPVFITRYSKEDEP